MLPCQSSSAGSFRCRSNDLTDTRSVRGTGVESPPGGPAGWTRTSIGGDGGESNSPSKTLLRRPLRACPMICRRPPERASAPCRAVQSRAPRSGLTPDYVTLVRIAASLDDASTTREAEVASTLTLPPKRRERESTGGCQVLLFATFLTRPSGVLGSRSPVTRPCRNHTSPQVREPARTRDRTTKPPGGPSYVGRPRHRMPGTRCICNPPGTSVRTIDAEAFAPTQTNGA